MKRRNSIGTMLGLVGLLGSGCATTSSVSKGQETSDGLARAAKLYSPRPEPVDSHYVQEMRTKYNCVGVGRSSYPNVTEGGLRFNAMVSYIRNCMKEIDLLRLVLNSERVFVFGLRFTYNPAENVVIAFCDLDQSRNCELVSDRQSLK